MKIRKQEALELVADASSIKVIERNLKDFISCDFLKKYDCEYSCVLGIDYRTKCKDCKITRIIILEGEKE